MKQIQFQEAEELYRYSYSKAFGSDPSSTEEEDRQLHAYQDVEIDDDLKEDVSDMGHDQELVFPYLRQWNHMDGPLARVMDPKLPENVFRVAMEARGSESMPIGVHTFWMIARTPENAVVKCGALATRAKINALAQKIKTLPVEGPPSFSTPDMLEFGERLVKRFCPDPERPPSVGFEEYVKLLGVQMENGTAVLPRLVMKINDLKLRSAVDYTGDIYDKLPARRPSYDIYERYAEMQSA